MPTYEYRCPQGHEFELFQRMTDPAEAKCPECGGTAERRLSAGAGLLFKGSGFYITDYRSEGYKKAAEAERGGGKDEKSGGKDEKSGGKDEKSGGKDEKAGGKDEKAGGPAATERSTGGKGPSDGSGSG